MTNSELIKSEVESIEALTEYKLSSEFKMEIELDSINDASSAEYSKKEASWKKLINLILNKIQVKSEFISELEANS